MPASIDPLRERWRSETGKDLLEHIVALAREGKSWSTQSFDHVQRIVNGRDLRGADLSRFDLEGADFSNAEPTDVNFEETTLYKMR